VAQRRPGAARAELAPRAGRHKKTQANFRRPGFERELFGTPNGIRTRAAGVKGRSPRPLDDGGSERSVVARAESETRRRRLRQGRGTTSPPGEKAHPRLERSPAEAGRTSVSKGRRKWRVSRRSQPARSTEVQSVRRRPTLERRPNVVSCGRSTGPRLEACAERATLSAHTIVYPTGEAQFPASGLDADTYVGIRGKCVCPLPRPLDHAYRAGKMRERLAGKRRLGSVDDEVRRVRSNSVATRRFPLHASDSQGRAVGQVALHHRPTRGAVGSESVGRGAEVSLLRWLRRQLRQPDSLRERLEAAIENDDAEEARRIVSRYEFSSGQRRQVDRLIDEWERYLHLPGHNPKRQARREYARSRRTRRAPHRRMWSSRQEKHRARVRATGFGAVGRLSCARPSTYPFPTTRSGR
jgi:hypothetical protein